MASQMAALGFEPRKHSQIEQMTEHLRLTVEWAERATNERARRAYLVSASVVAKTLASELDKLAS